MGLTKEEQDCAQRRYSTEEIITELMEAEVLPGQGTKVADVAKTSGISEVSY